MTSQDNFAVRFAKHKHKDELKALDKARSADLCR